jgi:hypothetical protein
MPDHRSRIPEGYPDFRVNYVRAGIERDDLDPASIAMSRPAAISPDGFVPLSQSTSSERESNEH